MENGFVTEGYGSWSSPSFSLPKKDEFGNKCSNKSRFIIDYRSLNKISKQVQNLVFGITKIGNCPIIDVNECHRFEIQQWGQKPKYISFQPLVGFKVNFPLT
jgi:hypothetical protein